MIRGEFPSYGWAENLVCKFQASQAAWQLCFFVVVDQGQIGWKWWVPQFKAGVVAKADHSFDIT